MRVAKPEHYGKTVENIVWKDYEKPIVVPRLPVITNDKQRHKLIKTIETYVRSSMEYKDLVKYLRSYIDMNSCEFFSNINATGKKGLLEIHHEPFDLYTIVDIVMKRHETELGYIDELMVADEVIRLHYEGMIGLIPLSVTPHELVHTGKLVVPLNCVYGQFVKFVKEYFEYCKEYIPILMQKLELTKNLSKEDYSILDVRYIYSNIDGFSLPQLIEENKTA